MVAREFDIAYRRRVGVATPYEISPGGVGVGDGQARPVDTNQRPANTMLRRLYIDVTLV